MKTLEERFLAKVDKTGECWEWRGFRSPQGYGMIAMKPAAPTTAHRISYELYVGPIPAGLTVDHLCNNRGCVNPAHLEAKTQQANILRSGSPSALNARKTHCPAGHLYDEANTYYRKDRFGRQCRTCGREQRRARHSSICSTAKIVK